MPKSTGTAERAATAAAQRWGKERRPWQKVTKRLREWRQACTHSTVEPKCRQPDRQPPGSFTYTEVADGAYYQVKQASYKGTAS